MTPRTKRTVAIVALTLVGLLAAGVVAAQAFMPGPRGPLRGFLSGLGLTDAQKEQVKAIIKDAQPRLEPLVDEVIRTKRALFQAATAPTFDESAVRAAADAAGKAAGALTVEKARAASLVRGVLTAEQQAKLDDALRRAAERREKRVNLRRTIWREHAGDFVDAL